MPTPPKDTAQAAPPAQSKPVVAPQKHGATTEVRTLMRSLASLTSPGDASRPNDPPLTNRGLVSGSAGRARLSASIQRSAGNARVSRMLAPMVQRRCACGEEAGPSGMCPKCAAANRAVQRRETESEAPSSLPSSVTHAMQSGGGEQLPDVTRTRMERAFGADMGGVRIHRGPGAARAADDINARAFTVGQDIYFGAGQYEPGTQPGQRLLAHELTHTVQQSNVNVVMPSQMPISHPGDPLEREAEAVADHVGGGTFEERDQPGRQALRVRPAQLSRRLQRADDEEDVNVAEYQKRFADEIGNGVVAAIKELPLETGSRFVTTTSSFVLGAAILGDSGAALTEKISAWVGGREKFGVILNRARPKGRVEVTDDTNTWIEDKQNEGPARWFSDVGVEVAQVVHKLLFESLARIIPRYLDAAVAIGIAEEKRKQQSLLTVPGPRTEDIVPSRPIDRNTIAVLTRFAKFEYQAYRAANPAELGAIVRLRPVFFSWDSPGTGKYWIRVTSPANPTPEEVARALYGSSEFAGEIKVAAAPLFGLADVSSLLPEHHQRLVSLGIDTQYRGDPVKEAMTGPRYEEVAKNQSKEPTSHITKTDVVRTIDQSLLILDSISASGARFGMDRGP